jgi:hypothetical protein
MKKGIMFSIAIYGGANVSAAYGLQAARQAGQEKESL